MSLVTFQPTVFGSLTAGSTTYTEQDGVYETNGDITTVIFRVTFDGAALAASASGNLIIGVEPSQGTAIIPVGFLSIYDNLNYPSESNLSIAGGENSNGLHIVCNTVNGVHSALTVTNLPTVSGTMVTLSGQITFTP